MDQAAISVIKEYPWLPWVWFAATILAVALRAGWPDEKDRPRVIVVVLAIVDFLQLNFSGPIKLLFKAPTK